MKIPVTKKKKKRGEETKKKEHQKSQEKPLIRNQNSGIALFWTTSNRKQNETASNHKNKWEVIT